MTCNPPNQYASFISPMAPGDIRFRLFNCIAVLGTDTISSIVPPTITTPTGITVSAISVVNTGRAVLAKLAISSDIAVATYPLLLTIHLASDPTLVFNRHVNLTIKSL